MPGRTPQIILTAAIALAAAGAAMRTGEPEIGTGQARWATPEATTPPEVLLPDPRQAANVSGKVAPSVHAATAVELPDGRLRAFWFGGSREGAKDVAIYTSTLGPGAITWSSPEIAIGRKNTARDTSRMIRKLGNPVAAMAPDGRLWLCYVSVSAGGWLGSALNITSSTDLGDTWTPAERLVTTPFANISTLAKAPPLHYQDGSLGLPIYHEMASKFPQLVRIDTQNRGRTEGRLTIPEGRGTIQPWIVPTSDTNALAFLRSTRDGAKAIHLSHTSDTGQTWSPPAPLELPNPNASVAAVHLGGESILLVFNDSTKNRADLSLAITRDHGASWEKLGSIETKDRLAGEKDLGRLEYSYPWLLKTKSGKIHLLYTWNRKEIRHLEIATKKGVSP